MNLTTNLRLLAGILIIGATVTLMTTIPAHATNLVTNGSFETPGSSCVGGFTVLGAGDTSIDGWTVGVNTIDWICTIWEATDGTKSIDLTGTPGAGSIYQVISTEAGATYETTFDMAGNPHCDAKLKSMTVSAAGSSEDFTFDTTGKVWPDDAFNMGYVQKSFTFTATSTSTTLEFVSNTPGSCGPVLDNVVMVKSGPTVITAIVDIKPGSDENPINTKSKGVIPVAVLSSADFDATTINPSTVTFGPNGATETHGTAHIEDVNGDGLDDVVLHFNTQDSGIVNGDTEACLSANLTDGTAIEGCDSVRTK